jgi:hypothetical protein
MTAPTLIESFRVAAVGAEDVAAGLRRALVMFEAVDDDAALLVADDGEGEVAALTAALARLATKARDLASASEAMERYVAARAARLQQRREVDHG